MFENERMSVKGTAYSLINMTKTWTILLLPGWTCFSHGFLSLPYMHCKQCNRVMSFIVLENWGLHEFVGLYCQLFFAWRSSQWDVRKNSIACSTALGGNYDWKCMHDCKSGSLDVEVQYLHTFTGKTEFWSVAQGIIAEDGKGIWEILELKMGFFPPTRQPYLTLLVPSSTLF